MQHPRFHGFAPVAILGMPLQGSDFEFCPRKWELVAWQTVDHAYIGPGIPSHYSVGLEGYEPALISALGGNFLAFQRIIGIVAIFECFEIDCDQDARPHEPLREDRKALADLGMEFIHMKTDGAVFLPDSPVANVKVLDKLVSAWMTDNPPVAFVIVRVLVQPELAHKIVQIDFRKGLPVFVDIDIRIGKFIVGYSGPGAEPAHGRFLCLVGPNEL